MDLETSTSSSPPPTDFSKTNSKRHPLYGGARRRSSRTDTREPRKRRRTRLQGPFPSLEMDAAAHADTQRADLVAARELSPASSSSKLSRNAGNSNISISVDGGGRAEFVDEEAILNMPLLLDCMAEGLLLTPPSMKKGFSWSNEDDGIFDFNLWEH